MNPFLSAICLTTLLVCWPAQSRAQDFPCPSPTEQKDANLKAEVDGKARALLKLGVAELKGNVESTVVDLFSKYPNADRVAIINSILSTTCYIIRNSKQFSDAEKLDKLMSVLPAIQALLPKEKSEYLKEDRCAAAETHWKSVDLMGSLSALRDHLARFPICPFAGLARARIQALNERGERTARARNIRGTWHGTIDLGQDGTYSGRMELFPVGDTVTGRVRFSELADASHSALYEIAGRYDGSMASGRLSIAQRSGQWCPVGTINAVLLSLDRLQVSVTGETPGQGSCPSWTRSFTRLGGAVARE